MATTKATDFSKFIGTIQGYGYGQSDTPSQSFSDSIMPSNPNEEFVGLKYDGTPVFKAKSYTYNEIPITNAPDSPVIKPVNWTPTDMGYQAPNVSDGLSVWEGIASGLQYIHGKLGQGVSNVIAGVSEIPNNAMKIASTFINEGLANPVLKALGSEVRLQGMSFSEMFSTTYNELDKLTGGKTTTEAIKDQTPFVQAKLSGKNWYAENAYKVSTQYGNAVQPINDKIREVSGTLANLNQVVGDVAQSAPLTGAYAIPVLGALLGTGVNFSNSIRDSLITAREDNLNNIEALNRGIYKASVQSYSELIFGLFGEVGALFASPIAKQVSSKVATTVGKLIAGVVLSAGEEGLEEVIAYPFDKFIDWRYANPDKPIQEYLDYLDITGKGGKEILYAGAVGFISGALFSVGQIAVNKVQDNKQQKLIKQAEELIKIKVNEIPSKMEEIKQFADDVAQMNIENNTSVFNKPVDRTTQNIPIVDNPMQFTQTIKDINVQLEQNGQPSIDIPVQNVQQTSINISDNVQPTVSNMESVVDSGEDLFNLKMADMLSNEPSANVQGIVDRSFADIIKDIPISSNNQNTYTGSFDSDVRKQIDESMSIKQDKTVSDRVSSLKSFVTRTFLRGSVNVPFEQGELRQRIQSYRQANTVADTKVENFILRIYNPIGKQNFKLMQDAVLFLDLKEDIINKRLYSEENNKPLPFGIKSVNDALRMIVDVESQLKNPKNSLVLQALQSRRETMDIVRKQLSSLSKEIGWDLSYLENRTDYMHHSIMEYIDESTREKHRTGVKSTAYKGREGSYKNYVSDPALSDYLVLRKMFKDIMKIGVFQELKTLDVKDTLKFDEDGKYIIPDGYAEFNRNQMGLNYIEQNLDPEIEIANFSEAIGNQIPIPPENIRLYKKNAQTKYNKKIIVIPIDIRDSIVKEFELKSNSDQSRNLQRIATQAWKKWQLESPRRVVKYNIKNFAGDTDAMLMIYPQAVKKIGKSFSELTDLYRNGKMTLGLSKYTSFGGLSTSLSTIELGDLQSLPHFTFYESETKIGKLAVNKFRRITNSIAKFTEWREQILRYAAYTQQVEDLSKSPNGLPKDYGASIPAEIKSIKTIEGRAFKLSNDALGAYNDVTPMAQGMSKTIYPFFRFREVNIKRFYRLAKNVFYSDSESVMNTGDAMANKFAQGAKVTRFAALRIGRIGLGYLAFTSALALFNNLAAPDEEKELPEDIRNSIHIVFPRWSNPNGEIMYFNDLSSFYQMFSDIGFDGITDVYDDLKEIINGKVTIGDKVKEIANGATSSFLNGMAPFYKPVIEAIVGKSIYPDISKPSTVRDPWEHLFKAVALDQEYRAIAGKPIPQGSYVNTWRKAVINSVVPGEAALWDVYDMKERYYTSIGKTGYSGSSRDPKAVAIYNYKVALKLDDTSSAERYLKQYAIYGGTQLTFKASMSALDPLYGMSKEDKKTFVETLSEEDMIKYNKASEYYKSIQSVGNPESLPKK